MLDNKDEILLKLIDKYEDCSVRSLKTAIDLCYNFAQENSDVPFDILMNEFFDSAVLNNKTDSIVNYFHEYIDNITNLVKPAIPSFEEISLEYSIHQEDKEFSFERLYLQKPQSHDEKACKALREYKSQYGYSSNRLGRTRDTEIKQFTSMENYARLHGTTVIEMKKHYGCLKQS